MARVAFGGWEQNEHVEHVFVFDLPRKACFAANSIKVGLARVSLSGHLHSMK